MKTSLRGWNLNLKPKRKPAYFGVLPPETTEPDKWDATANKWVGKIIKASMLFEDSTYENWLIISENGNPHDADATYALLMDMAYIHRDNLYGIPECICDVKSLLSGCKCGCIQEEKKFKSLISLAKK